MKPGQNFHGRIMMRKVVVIPRQAYDSKNPFKALDDVQSYSVTYDWDDPHPDVATLEDLLDGEFAKEFIDKGIRWKDIRKLVRNVDLRKRELKVAMSVPECVAVGSLSW